MSFITRIWCSSLGKKYIMAITGFVLFIFLIGHMAGNMLIFLGPEDINRYGNFLQTTPEILWPARIILLLMLVLHFVSSAQLTFENRVSRSTQYNEYEVKAANYAARTMIVSGLVILFFVVYHLLHFTIPAAGMTIFGQDYPAILQARERHQVYEMMVLGFKHPLVCGFYMLAIALLCAHLSHGVSSMFQSIGWKNKYYGKFIDKFALGAAVVLFLGYWSIPLSVLLRFVK